MGLGAANCSCGAEEQTADHILAFCPLYYPPNETLGLAALDNDTVTGLKQQHSASNDTTSALTKKITFPSDGATLAFFGAGEIDCFHYMEYCLVSGSL